MALAGPNGAGKTTLFRLLMGFMRPVAGRCRIGGVPPAEYRRRHGVGYLPENATLPRGWPGRQLLARGADLSVHPGQSRREFTLALERTGLDSATLSREGRKCSRGTQRRLWLAYALIGDPLVLLLDEPFSGLDTPSRRALRHEMRTARERGAAVIFATHELSEVERLADAIVVIEDGATKEARALPGYGNSPVADLEAELFGKGA